MKKIFWESVVIEALSEKPLIKIPPSVQPPSRPQFTETGAALAVQLLQKRTMEKIVQHFCGHPILCLRNDKVVPIGLDEEDFWEELGTWWDDTTMIQWWQYLTSQPKFPDPSENFIGCHLYSWCALYWREHLNKLNKFVRAQLPNADWSRPNVKIYHAQTPFPLRALVAQTLVALSQRHRLGESPWLSRLHAWVTKESLSYEDGDVLRGILSSSNLLDQYQSIITMEA